jgi:hypothetical protein
MSLNVVCSSYNVTFETSHYTATNERQALLQISTRTGNTSPVLAGPAVDGYI